jgi:tricorn protease-like protein
MRTNSNTKTCAITGIVQQENKTVLFADSENNELKIMNEETFNIIVTRELPNNPYLMCFVTENKVIIACINYEFHLVDLNADIDIQILFKIEHLFKSIACVKNELFGCTSDTVEVYSGTGKQISKFKPVDVTDIEDMCVSKEGDIIYCADEKKGLVVLDKHGTVVYIISENLCQPYRLCHGHQGYIFVTEKNSDRVMQIDIQRKKVEQIGRDDCYTKDSPVSLCHEKRNNRLIVAVWQSDEVHVYTCL